MIRIILILNLFVQAAISSPSGVGTPDVLWPNGNVRVCFAGDAWATWMQPDVFQDMMGTQELLEDMTAIPSNYKTHLRELLVSQYNKKTTGVEFTGWKNCSEMSSQNVDLVIIGHHFAPGLYARTIGKSSVTEKPGNNKKSYIFYSTDSSIAPVDNATLDFVVLHEAGHVVGLRHEHLVGRYENQQFCNLFERGNFGETLIHMYTPRSVEYTDYDSTSIMSYCYIGLSERVSYQKFIYDTKEELVTPIVKLEKYIKYLKKDEPITMSKTWLEINQRHFEIIERKNSTITMRVKPILSLGDIYTLRCLYGLNDQSECSKLKLIEDISI